MIPVGAVMALGCARARGSIRAGMGMVLATVAALVTWIVLWAYGAKPLDAALVGAVIPLVAATVRIVARHLPGRQGE
jgi:hypothetical protein